MWWRILLRTNKHNFNLLRRGGERACHFEKKLYKRRTLDTPMHFIILCTQLCATTVGDGLIDCWLENNFFKKFFIKISLTNSVTVWQQLNSLSNNKTNNNNNNTVTITRNNTLFWGFFAFPAIHFLFMSSFPKFTSAFCKCKFLSNADRYNHRSFYFSFQPCHNSSTAFLIHSN